MPNSCAYDYCLLPPAQVFICESAAWHYCRGDAEIAPQTSPGKPVQDRAGDALFFVLKNEATCAPFQKAEKNVENDEEITESVVSMLAGIREQFQLNTSEMARLFDISRPTMYRWLRGEVVDPIGEKYGKIARLYELSRKTQALMVERLDLLMFRPMFEEGRSFFELLREDSPAVDEALRKLKAIADEEALIRAGTVSKPSMRSAREALDSVSVPFSRGE